MSSVTNSQNGTNSVEQIDDFSNCAPADLWMRVICLIAGSLCIVIGGAGNLTTLVSIITVRSLWRFANINIFLLAICDFVITTYITGQYMNEYWHGCWPYTLWYCHVFLTINAASYGVSMALLALVAYDRYLMVKLGADYKRCESRWTVAARACGAFLVMLLMNLFAINLHWFTGVTVNSVTPGHRTMCIAEVVQNGAFQLAWLAVSIAPIFVMLFCYVAVMKYHKTSSSSANAISDATVHSTMTQIKARKRAARAALLVNLLFLVLLVTNALFFVTVVFVSFFAFGYWLSLDVAWWVNLYALSFPIAWLNNAINPILYAYVMPDFRQAAGWCWARLFSILPEKFQIHATQATNLDTSTVTNTKARRAVTNSQQAVEMQQVPNVILAHKQ